ncbi:hypothetical protein V0242_11200 [Aeromonas hydrophila]|uniref:hypothetical protein n=1 Tax=Aeromonas hydrophila TaxID=644 RepID=UPI002ED40463|nr:hypothetical protein V0242_11200 [Aeromonas hydrophila]
MSIFNKTSLFVNHEIAGYTTINKTAKAKYKLESMKIQLDGAIRDLESNANNELRKSLKIKGFGTADFSGRKVQDRIKKMLPATTDIKSVKWCIHEQDDHMFITLVDIHHDIKLIGTDFFADVYAEVYIAHVDMTGERISTSCYVEKFEQKHRISRVKPNLVHHFKEKDVMKMKKNNQHTVKRVEAKIEINSRADEVALAVKEIAEIVNHNAAITEKTQAQNEALIKILVDNGIQVPFEMVADHSEDEDEYQLQDQFELDAVIANTHPIRYQ